MYAVRLAGGLALARRAAALLTPEGSPCRTLCGNTPDSTSEDEIVCDDVAYADDDAGVLYQQCVTCEMTSNYHTDSNDTDVDAMLCMAPVPLFWRCPQWLTIRPKTTCGTA